jgi:hypothetical protein
MSKLPWELDKLDVSALGFVFGSFEIELSRWNFDLSGTISNADLGLINRDQDSNLTPTYFMYL